jgi:hypothetical protein
MFLLFSLRRGNKRGERGTSAHGQDVGGRGRRRRIHEKGGHCSTQQKEAVVVQHAEGSGLQGSVLKAREDES